MTIIDRFLNSILFWAAWIIIPLVMEIVPSLGSVIILIKKTLFPKKYPELTY